MSVRRPQSLANQVESAMTELASVIAFIFSILYMFLALFGKRENEKRFLLYSIHSLLMCIALGIWSL